MHGVHDVSDAACCALAGHAPALPLVHAAWAASTVTTLNRLLPCDAEAAGNVAVEFSIPTGGRRGDSQNNAARGIVAPRQVGPPREGPRQPQNHAH